MTAALPPTAGLPQLDPFTVGAELMRSRNRALRHRLGSEYTPRAYVARLVRQVLAPVFDEWETTQRYAAALAITYRGDAANRALELVADFHRRLCAYTCLDPAAGTGNILVVVIETFVELEAEAVAWLRWFGAPAEVLERSVTLAQFRGIEVDPEAWRISRMVLPLAWMQARQRHGLGAPRGWDPVKVAPVELRDAVLAWDEVVDVPEKGRLRTRARRRRGEARRECGGGDR